MNLTREYIENTFVNIFQVDYKSLDYLLSKCTKLGSNVDKNGVNWTAYLFDARTVVITGRGELFGKKIDKELAQEYDKLARWTLEDTRWSKKEELIEQTINRVNFVFQNIK